MRRSEREQVMILERHDVFWKGGTPCPAENINPLRAWAEEHISSGARPEDFRYFDVGDDDDYVVVMYWKTEEEHNEKG